MVSTWVGCKSKCKVSLNSGSKVPGLTAVFFFRITFPFFELTCNILMYGPNQKSILLKKIYLLKKVISQCTPITVWNFNTYEIRLYCQPLIYTLNLWLWWYWKTIFGLLEGKWDLITLRLVPEREVKKFDGVQRQFSYIHTSVFKYFHPKLFRWKYGKK